MRLKRWRGSREFLQRAVLCRLSVSHEGGLTRQACFTNEETGAQRGLGHLPDNTASKPFLASLNHCTLHRFLRSVIAGLTVVTGGFLIQKSAV